MIVSVVSAIRSRDGDGRQEIWEWLRARWLHLFPDWEYCVHHGSYPDEPWVKADAIASAVAGTCGEILVVTDADVMVDASALRECIVALAGGEYQWAVPFGDVYRLSAAETERLRARDVTIRPEPLERRLLDPDRPPYRGKPGGGVVVVTREAWDDVGGMDPRFRGWGGEDYALGYALLTCAGERYRTKGAPLWHLWHRPAAGYDASGRLPDDARRLLRRYRVALRDLPAMRALLEERTIMG